MRARHEALSKAVGLDVSRETFERLDLYAALTKKWTKKINLVSKASVEDLWSRHICDSAQIWRYRPEILRNWVDLGSGGGFPGIVIACLADRDVKVTLVESDGRKSEFLRSVIRALSLSATVETNRIETVDPFGADALSARALAPLSTLLEYCEKHLEPGGRALLPKGRNHAQEVAEALATWSFKVETHPSHTDPAAVILEIGEITRV